MSNKGYSSIKLLDGESSEDDEELITQQAPKENKPELQFQDFPLIEDESLSAVNFQTTSIQQASDVEDDEDDDGNDQNELLKGTKKAPSFWTFEYYQAFFDVDAHDVLGRITHSMIPSKQNYLLTKIRPNPDLYGPFWICTTLVFTIAICGNLSNFFASEGTDTHFKSDFRLVSLSACVIFSYGWLVPAILWGYLLWRGNIANFSFLEIVCVYGYSLAVFIPISIIWIAPFDWLRWVLVLVGVIVSGSVLVLTFWTALSQENIKVAALTVFGIILLHTVLAIGFKLYFFKSITIHDHVVPTTAATFTTTVKAAIKTVLSTTPA